MFHHVKPEKQFVSIRLNRNRAPAPWNSAKCEKNSGFPGYLHRTTAHHQTKVLAKLNPGEITPGMQYLLSGQPSTQRTLRNFTMYTRGLPIWTGAYGTWPTRVRELSLLNFVQNRLRTNSIVPPKFERQLQREPRSSRPYNKLQAFPVNRIFMMFYL